MDFYCSMNEYITEILNRYIRYLKLRNLKYVVVGVWVSSIHKTMTQASQYNFFGRSESAMSRKGIGDRMKAKTNVATVRLASALGFQVRIKYFYGSIKYFLLSAGARQRGRGGGGAEPHHDAGHGVRAWRVPTADGVRAHGVSRYLISIISVISTISRRVDLMPRTIIGVICAADYYQFTGHSSSLDLDSRLV